jgi:hypothetical protein
MAKVEVLTLASLAGLVNLNSLYLLGYAWLFGMCEFGHVLNVGRAHLILDSLLSRMDLVLRR